MKLCNNCAHQKCFNQEKQKARVEERQDEIYLSDLYQIIGFAAEYAKAAQSVTLQRVFLRAKEKDP